VGYACIFLFYLNLLLNLQDILMPFMSKVRVDAVDSLLHLLLGFRISCCIKKYGNIPSPHTPCQGMLGVGKTRISKRETEKEGAIRKKRKENEKHHKSVGEIVDKTVK
jgi:hypothetical protein